MSVTTITNKVKKVNLYFFGEEVIHWEDATWFYGGSGLALLITTIVCLPI